MTSGQDIGELKDAFLVISLPGLMFRFVMCFRQMLVDFSISSTGSNTPHS